MKLKIPLLAALMAIIPVSGSGFTLDAVGYTGAGLERTPGSIDIVGYGEVIFESGEGEAIMVSSGYLHDTLPPNPDLNFDPKDAVSIELDGRRPKSAQFVFAGIPPMANAAVDPDAKTGFGEGEISQEEKPYGVPETASALLGLLGMVILMLRRLR